MKIVKIIYIILLALEIIVYPSMFGKKRPAYSYKHWIIEIIFSIPLIYILIKSI